MLTHSISIVLQGHKVYMAAATNADPPSGARAETWALERKGP